MRSIEVIKVDLTLAESPYPLPWAGDAGGGVGGGSGIGGCDGGGGAGGGDIIIPVK